MSTLTWVYIVIEVLERTGPDLPHPDAQREGWGSLRHVRWIVGAAAQGSTVVERNLDRITVTVAIVFAFATITLDLRLQ